MSNTNPSSPYAREEKLMPDSPPELKACAHCDSLAHQPYFGERVECMNEDCESSTPTVAAWNSRTPDPEAAAEIKALREVLEPFAKAADMADERMIGRFGEAVLPPETSFAIGLNLTLGHLQDARAALKDHRKAP